MSPLELDGNGYLSLVEAGALCLKAHYEEVDSLNVFPVPDGDTGTNMFRTIAQGVSNGKEHPSDSISAMAETIASGMLMGARGNSGVILSQIFRGIANGLVGKESVTAFELAEAYRSGVTQAYSAVITPVEGTILTVFREATEYAFSMIDEHATIEDFYQAHLDKAVPSLANTPNLLAVLKEAGVVDSGGAGYVYIVRGMLGYLLGEEIEGEIAPTGADASASKGPDFAAFTRDDVLEFGYCTEFILRLQSSKVDVDSFSVQTVIDYLQGEPVNGNSIVCFKDGDIIKTHVHTKDPGYVLAKMRDYGEFLTIKVENMALQHNEIMLEEAKAQEEAPHKKFGIVAVATGEGLKQAFRELGADAIVEGDNTMNPSAEDFLRAYEKVNADVIFVFPNNKNILMAANQSASLYQKADIRVIPCVSIPACYSCLLSMDLEDQDLDGILASFSDSLAHVASLEITHAIRDCTLQGIEIHDGDAMGFRNGKLVASKPTRFEALKALLSSIEDIEERGLCMVVFGQEVEQAEKDEALAYFEEAYPNLEVGPLDGGQSVYSYWINVD